MQILCEVNQAECFRRGIDAPRSTMKIEVDPAKLPEEIREFLADHLHEGDKLSARDDFQLLRPDLLGFMETVLTAKEYKEANDHNHAESSLMNGSKVQVRMRRLSAKRLQRS